VELATANPVRLMQEEAKGCGPGADKEVLTSIANLRGSLEVRLGAAEKKVVMGNRAEWIWKPAEQYFPGAVTDG
jgi:hypothetical protein